MSKIYSVCETSNIRAVHYAERIWDAVADFDVENGTIGYLEDPVDEGVIHTFKAGTMNGKVPVLVHMPEWSEDTSNRLNQRKDKFVNVAGVPFRCFTLKEGDEFALSPEGFSGEPVVGKYVSVNTNGKLAVADTPVDGAVLVGKIMRKRQIGSTLVTKVREYGYARMMYTVKITDLSEKRTITV